MKEKYFLALIFLCNILLKYWRLGTYPKLFDPVFFNYRLLSSTGNILVIIIFYYYIKGKFGSIKLALLSSLIFTTLPLTIVESRIASSYSLILFLFMLIILISSWIRLFYLRVCLLLLIIISISLIYPQIWQGQFYTLITPLKYISNFFELMSFDLLFFKNESFYWGGIRETGLLYLFMLPLFLSGIYTFIVTQKYKPLLLFLLIFAIIPLAPLFPENRAVYFSIPLLSLIVATGLIRLLTQKVHSRTILIGSLTGFFVYEFILFLHFYFIHYQKQVIEFHNKITGPF